MVSWKNVTVSVVKMGRRLVYRWTFHGYRHDDPTPVRRFGYTYTAWGARRKIQRIILGKERT